MHRYRYAYVLELCLFLLLAPQILYALPRTVERGKVETSSAVLLGDFVGLTHVVEEASKTVCNDPLCPVSVPNFALTLESAGLGKVQLLFDTVRSPKAIKPVINGNPEQQIESETILLRGYARLRHFGETGESSWQRIGATVYVSKHGNYLEVFLPRAQRRSSHLTGLPIVAWIDLASGKERKLGRLLRAPRQLLKSAECAADHLKGSPASYEVKTSNKPPVAKASTRTIYISSVYDAEWYSIFGASSNSKILSVVNASSAVYEQQFSLNFIVRNQSGFTSTTSQPVTSFQSETALSQFRSYGINSTNLSLGDLSSLFSGKSLQDGVIGIAYSAVACVNRGYSFSLITYYSDAATWITHAHETGHSLSAAHDDSSNNIMSTFLGSTLPSIFAPLAVSQINSHLNSYYAQCIGIITTPTPTPTGGSPTVTPTSGGGGGGGGTSPTPTPTPTVPADGGGPGGGPGGNDNAPITKEISIYPKISSSGLVKIKLSSSLSNANCQMVVRGAGTSGAASSGMSLYSADFVPGVEMNISGLVGFKISKTDSKSSSKVFLQAELQCSGSVLGRSATKGIDPGKIVSKKSLNKKKWLQTLSTVLSEE